MIKNRDFPQRSITLTTTRNSLNFERLSLYVIIRSLYVRRYLTMDLNLNRIKQKKRKLFDEFCEMTSLPCSIRNDIFLPSLPPRRWNISESLVRLKLGNIFVWKSWNDIDRDDVFPEKTNQLRKTNICFGLPYLFIRLFVRGFLSFSFYLRSVNKVSFHMLITSSQTEHSAWQRWSVFKKRNTVAFLNFAVLLLSMF